MGRHPEVLHDALLGARQNAQRALPPVAQAALLPWWVGGIPGVVLMGHDPMLAPGLTSVKLNSMTLEFIIPDA